MGLLSGLERFGLGSLENMEVYEKTEKTENSGGRKVMREQDYLFDKSYTCPVCGKEFKNRTVKTGRVKLSGSDRDLRPRYEQLDILKYDVILCPACGYTALSRFYDHVTPTQAGNIKNMISSRFTSPQEIKEMYTYDEALERYQLALVNAVVKKAKASEKAYICLKTAWLLRGRAEKLDQSLPDYEKEKAQCAEKEREFLSNAMKGFLDARQSEAFPMCGMDQFTVDYLISAIAVEFEQYDLAGRLVAGILQSAANPRVKNRARDLKADLMEKIKERKNG